MTVIFYRTNPLPKCRVCGRQMEYWILGLPDAKHSHPECYAKEAVAIAFKKLRKEEQQCLLTMT